jgi:hypothetical protein
MSSPLKDRLFRGYGPLIGFAAMFLAVVLLVPSKAPTGAGTDLSGDASSVLDGLEGGTDAAEEEAAAGDLAFTDADGDGVPDDPSAAGVAGSGGSGSTSGGGTGGGGARAAGGGAGDPAAQAAKGPAKVAGCEGPQVPGDPYSPPCIQFSGGNGGATYRGVTDKDIVVAVRIDGFDSGLVDAVTATISAGNKFPKVTREQVERTLQGLAEYFNKRFQFYGRQIRLVIYDGKGDVLNEIVSGGQEGAQADALKVADEIKAFADISAVTPPYATALTSKGVLNVGAPYVSRGWLQQRRPFSWTTLTDCTTVVESVSSYYAVKMAGGVAGNAVGNGADGKPLNATPRRTAVIAPENPEYQSCVNAGISLLEQQGKAGDLKARHKYTLSVNSSADVNAILPKLKADNITTVLCGCDPVFLNYMTAAMNNAGYFPEMLVTGVALVDTDLVGQVLQQNVWRNAFGISYAGDPQPLQQSLGYRAYKSVRADEPSFGVELLFGQLELLAIGIQMAGPDLNPATFEKGMFDYPPASGPYGTWNFGPNDYSTSDDAKEIFWNPDAQSVLSGTRGAYQDPNGGKRFPIGQWPGGQPKAFGR